MEDAAERAMAVRRRARRRAIADTLAVAALVPTVAVVGGGLDGEGHRALLIGVGALSLGILFIVVRRGRDAMEIARADNWRAQAVAGRGISLAEWQDGRDLPGWESRRDAPLEGDGAAGKCSRGKCSRQGVPCDL